MSVPVLVVATLAGGGALAWATHLRELRRAPTPTVCSRAIDEVYGIDGSAIADSVLLTRLLAHRDRCIADAAFVDHARRLLLELHRADAARALLDDAERRGALTPAEVAAERAWVDLEESQVAERRHDTTRARALRARATAVVHRLHEQWPEWRMPYTIMYELPRTALAHSAGATRSPAEIAALEDEARHRVATGAFVRSLTRAEALVGAFLAGALGVIGLGVIASAATSIGEMQRTRTSIASAEPGPVALTGTLHLPAKADAVIGPLSTHAGVWYAVEMRYDVGRSRSPSFRERSARGFLLRDPTGDVTIDPNGLTVRTRHSVTKAGGASRAIPLPRLTERMLWEGDEVHVLGELAEELVAGRTARRVRLPEDGRRLLVSNRSEAWLVGREIVRLGVGAALVLLSVSAIFWGYAQRFQVRSIPGVLE